MPTPGLTAPRGIELLRPGPSLAGPLRLPTRYRQPTTPRRYIDNLQELRRAVEGQRGPAVGGGYPAPAQLLPAATVDAERRRGSNGGDRPRRGAATRARRRRRPSGERAREDPPRLANDAAATGRGARGGGRVHELRGVKAEVLLLVSDAIQHHRGLHTSRPTRRSRASAATRELSPYGLVVDSGRWYLPAHDHGREALRTFRVDRMDAVSMTTVRLRAVAEGFDAVAHVAHSLASVPWRFEVEVVLDLPLAATAERIRRPLPSSSMPARGAQRCSHPRRSLDWMASVLARLGCDFTVVRPPELRQSVPALARPLATRSPTCPERARTPNENSTAGTSVRHTLREDAQAHRIALILCGALLAAAAAGASAKPGSRARRSYGFSTRRPRWPTGRRAPRSASTT